MDTSLFGFVPDKIKKMVKKKIEEQIPEIIRPRREIDTSSYAKVRSPNGLQKAVDKSAEGIVVTGALAEALHACYEKSPLGSVGKQSFTGVEIALLITTAAVALTLVIAVVKGYDEISYEPGPPPKIILKKRS